MGVKIAVVGGGSTYTPELVDGLAMRADRVPVDEVVLLDPDVERLAVVAGLAGRILRRRGFGGRLVATGDRAAALDGADFIVVQLRVGGQSTRLLDETIPALRRARQAGKVRFLGFSGYPMKIFKSILDQTDMDCVLSYNQNTLQNKKPWQS